MLHPKQIDLLYGNLGNQIKEGRERLNYKQAQFADLLKISRGSLVNIEKGRQRPPIHTIYEIARILEIDIISILPSLQTVLGEENVSSKLREKVVEKSGGDKDIEIRLLQFIQHHTTPVKAS